MRLSKPLKAIPLLLMTIAYARTVSVYAQDLSEMSIEQLLDVEVTSVSKHPQQLKSTPAAVYVISKEDIANGTARTIPDLLRMVPGLDVAQFDGNKWSISIRGSQTIYANKLLVLIDGKTAYSPLFSGVYWDSLTPILKDVERIEIIRGPGGAIWGVNAVNGVINIITKSAKDTEGTYAEVGGGNIEPFSAKLRVGKKISDDTSVRTWATTTNLSNLKSEDGGKANDGSENYHLGARSDTDIDSDQKLSFLVNGYRNNHRSIGIRPTADFTSSELYNDSGYGAGLTAQGSYQYQISDKSTWEVKAFFDRFLREDIGLNGYTNTSDLELQDTYDWSDRLKLVYGTGVRIIRSTLYASDIVSVSTDQQTQSNYIFNLYGQAEYQLLPNELTLTGGTKLEHVTYTGWESEPSARLGWNINKDNFLWTSVSRGIRIPSRTEDSVRIDNYVNGVDPTTGLPYSISIVPNRDLQSEKVYSYQAGYRSDLTSTVSLDVTAFYSSYDRLVGNAPQPPYLTQVNNMPSLVIPFLQANVRGADTDGLETAISWKPSSRGSIKIAQTFYDEKVRRIHNSPVLVDYNDGDNTSPKNQFSILGDYRVTQDLNVSAWLGYISSLSSISVDSYMKLDLRAKYSLTHNVSLNIYGANLIDQQLQSRTDFLIRSTELPRAVFGSVEFEF